MTTWVGGGAFDRAPLALTCRDDPTHVLVVRGYSPDAVVAEGDLTDRDGWGALISAGSAMPFDGGNAISHGWFWLFRATFPMARQQMLAELGDERLMVGDSIQGEGGAIGCVVDDLRATSRRVALAAELASQARAMVDTHDWRAAERFASAAFDVEVRLTPSTLAMLVHALQSRGCALRADGYRTMAAN